MIPLSIPNLNGNELKYVEECIRTGWVSSAGAFVSRFEKDIASFTNSDYGVATVNGTAGLHLALHVLGIGKGDLVAVPNLTFIASANAIHYTGATPLLVDVDPDTWQMDLDLLESYLADGEEKEKIAAIMPVHILGSMCDMERLMHIAKKYNLPVVEDATEALGSSWNSKSSGSWGDLGVFSFNGNKIITTGGGGMIVTDNEGLAVQAKHLSTQAKQDPENYFHDEVGYNYRLVNVLAAIGVAQMEGIDSFIKRKKAIDARYRRELGEIEDIKFQLIPSNVDHNGWLFSFYSSKKDQIMQTLKESNIVCRPLWVPMNQLPMYSSSLYIQEYDRTANIHSNVLSIPCSTSLTEDEQSKVIELIHSCY